MKEESRTEQSGTEQHQVSGRFLWKHGVLYLKPEDGKTLNNLGLTLPGSYSTGLNVTGSFLWCLPVETVFGDVPPGAEGTEVLVAIVPQVISVSVSKGPGEPELKTLSLSQEGISFHL